MSLILSLSPLPGEINLKKQTGVGGGVKLNSFLPGEELRLYTSRPEPTWLVTWSSVRDISAMGTTGALKESSEGPSARMDLPLR